MDKNTRMLLSVFAVVVVMTGLAFAAVPAYRVFCRVTGFAGTTQQSTAAPGPVLERKITVQFNADISAALPWTFKPEQRKITVNVGQQALASFYAKNRTDKPTAGAALYNVTPLKVGKYFHKIQCFCFSEQILEAGQGVSMPVLFYIDPSIAADKSMDDVTTVTLSYSFFPAESEELDTALEDFYNQ